MDPDCFGPNCLLRVIIIVLLLLGTMSYKAEMDFCESHCVLSCILTKLAPQEMRNAVQRQLA